MPLTTEQMIGCLKSRIWEIEEKLRRATPKHSGPLLEDIEAAEKNLVAYFQEERRKFYRGLLTGRHTRGDSTAEALDGNPLAGDRVDPTVDPWSGTALIVRKERGYFRRTGGDPDISHLSEAIRSDFERAVGIFNHTGDCDLTTLAAICLDAIMVSDGIVTKE